MRITKNFFWDKPLRLISGKHCVDISPDSIKRPPWHKKCLDILPNSNCRHFISGKEGRGRKRERESSRWMKEGNVTSKSFFNWAAPPSLPLSKLKMTFFVSLRSQGRWRRNAQEIRGNRIAHSGRSDQCLHDLQNRFLLWRSLILQEYTWYVSVVRQRVPWSYPFDKKSADALKFCGFILSCSMDRLEVLNSILNLTNIAIPLQELWVLPLAHSVPGRWDIAREEYDNTGSTDSGKSKLGFHLKTLDAVN